MTNENASTERRLAMARDAVRAAALLDEEGELDAAERELTYASALYAQVLGRSVAPMLRSDDASRISLTRRVREGFGLVRAMDHEAETRVHGNSSMRARVRRTAASFVVFVLLVAAYFSFALGARPFANVSASAVFSDDPLFDGGKACDGQVDTEWLLPDHTSGHLDLVVFPPRDIRQLIIVNGHNRQFMDRAVRRFEVHLYRDGVMVHSERGEFRDLTSPGQRLEIRIGRRVADVDHVRFVVLDHMGLGSALAEIILR